MPDWCAEEVRPELLYDLARFSDVAIVKTLTRAALASFAGDKAETKKISVKETTMWHCSLVS